MTSQFQFKTAAYKNKVRFGLTHQMPAPMLTQAVGEFQEGLPDE